MECSSEPHYEQPAASIPCLPQPRNTILFIGDGMGREHERAGSVFAHGEEHALAFHRFPYRGSVSTFASNNLVTDSAAATTAMACGRKVNVGVVSEAIPGDGGPLTTLLERSAQRGKAIGLVTTAFMTHATMAGFGAHELSRYNCRSIAEDLFALRPNVLLGGARYITTAQAHAAQYEEVVEDANELDAIDPTTAYLSGQFGDGHMPYVLDGRGNLPSLPDMTQAALSILEKDADGFFLVVEAARIDHAGHANDVERLVREVAELGEAVNVAWRWAQGQTDTLIVVTADHETGGLVVQDDTGDKGVAPTARWSTDAHTADRVGIYAWGVNASYAAASIDNTDVFRLLGGCEEHAAAAGSAGTSQVR
ncbi:MAG: alkaline phosphatase [Myxococcota bacterium]